MTLVFLPAVGVGMLVLWVILSAWTSSRRGASEERAHASAWRRRKLLGATAKRRKDEATVMVLGNVESRMPCRLKHVSRSSLRASSDFALPDGAQVRVEWGDDYFIGNVVSSAGTEFGHNLEIAVLSSTYGENGLLTKLIGRLQS